VLAAALLSLVARSDVVPAGTPVLEEPDARSRRLAVVDEDADLPVLETRGAWLLVRYGGYKGWVRLSGASGPEGLSRAESARLARAQHLLPHASETRLGPLPLLTDVTDGALVARLAAIAENVPSAYTARYGLDAPWAGTERVILFAREEDYAAFAKEEPSLAGLKTAGNAGKSVAALVAGGRDADEAGALLVHELVHLLNARAFVGELPPWLEEGLAEELSYSVIGADGRLDPGTLRVRRSRSMGESLTPAGRMHWVRYDLYGPRALAGRLADAARKGLLLPLRRLVALDWYTFTETSGRTTTYPESALLLRWLLEDKAQAPRVRRFLATAAAGGPASASALSFELGLDMNALDGGFRTWLARFETPRPGAR
jgi:hypothetical protein